MSYAKRLVSICALTIVTLAALSPEAAFSAVSFTGDVTLGTSMTIGSNSFGTFRIDGGSVYGGGSPSFNSVSIGSQAGSLGMVTVTDPGSQWLWGSSSGSLTVGNSGSGRLDILNGAAVVMASSSSSVTIASGTSSQGTVNVQGAGSTLYTSGLNLGQSSSSGGSALLQIGNGAIVNAVTNFSNGGTTIWGGGRLELNGGLLRTYSLTQNGTVIGSGEVSLQSSGTFTNSGRLEADANQLLRFTGSQSLITSTGAIIADGGEIEFQRSLTNSTNQTNAGEISLRNGRFRAGTTLTSGTQLTNSGNLASIGGESDVYGRVTNTTTGNIAATNNSVLRFHDDVTADGIVTVFPGSRAIFLEDLTMNAGSTLQANLAGTAPTTSYGTAEVVGAATLAGSLSATLEEGYVPKPGDSFVLLSASSLAGSPTLGQMPALASNLAWDLDAVGNQLVLSIVPALAGDYNTNGTVDAGDYVVWRKTNGQQGHGLLADGTGNGAVDADDLAVWRANFGATSTGLGAAVAVPEPASTALLLAATIFLPLARRNRIAC
jgi:T5SS/PEP-CTERM-associated repeat protein